MIDNVYICVREGGKLVEERRGHNVWVERGRSYLARLVSLLTTDPDLPEEDSRLRYMGVGIGGFKQSHPSVSQAPLNADYPVGNDPNSTAGNKYRDDFPINPLISTLERPVRISGGSMPYPGDPGDIWLKDGIVMTHLSRFETTLHCLLDGQAGDVVYGAYAEMPLSEVGLFLNEPGVQVDAPYGQLVAYFPFATIMLTTQRSIQIIWSVKF